MPGDAKRPRGSAGKSVFKLVRPTCVIEKVRSNERQIDVATFFDRLTAIHCFEDGELTRFFLDQARDAIEKLPALASRHSAPGLVISAPRGFHREMNVARIPSAISASVSSVAGLIDGKYLPDRGLTNFPSMKSS